MKLNACRICGGEMTMTHHLDPDASPSDTERLCYYVICTVCKASGPWRPTSQEASYVWNTWSATVPVAASLPPVLRWIKVKSDMYKCPKCKETVLYNYFKRYGDSCPCGQSLLPPA